MLSRAFNVAALVTRIGELKARLSLAAVRQAGVTTIGYAAAALLAVAAVCGFLGAGYIALSRLLGPAEALAVISGVGLGISALVLLATYLYSRTNAGKDLRVQISDEEKLLRSAVGMTEPDKNASGDKERPVSDSSAQAFSNVDPVVIAAAGFAVAGLLGPARLIRVMRFTIGIGSAAALINRAMRERQNAHDKSESRPAPTPASKTPTPTPTAVKRKTPDNGAVLKKSEAKIAVSRR
jgi:hypothetical protein